ncbi:MAG: hypothetical protein R6W76_17515, partial [Caldilinea sp.]
AKIIVVIGNPPYNGFAGVSPAEEMGLVDVYKQGLVAEWGIKKFNLDDLYVRFFGLAERRIAGMTGKGGLQDGTADQFWRASFAVETHSTAERCTGARNQPTLVIRSRLNARKGHVKG